MSATIIDGKIIAADLRAAVKAETQRLHAAHGIVPGLAVVLIGDDPASQSYVASKSRAVAEVGMRPFDHHLPAGVSETELVALVQKLNADPVVHGVLVQMPLPPQISTKCIVASIDPDKDVDGFHPLNAGRLFTGLPALAPCTPIACIKLIKTVHASLAGREASGARNKAKPVQGAAFRSGGNLSRREARCLGGNQGRRRGRPHRQAGYFCAGDFGFRQADPRDRGHGHCSFH